MNKLLLSIFLASTIFNSSAGFAADPEETGARRITQLGCSRGEQPGGECFVNLDGEAFGPAGCTSNQARWAPQKENGRSILALLMAAWAGNELVNLAIEGVCWTQPSSGNRGSSWVAWVNAYHVGDAP